MNRQPHMQGLLAQVNLVRRRQTHRRVLYVLLGVPLGVGYWLLLLAALIVDLLLFVPRLLLMLVLLLVNWIARVVLWLPRRLGRTVLRLVKFLAEAGSRGRTALRRRLRRGAQAERSRSQRTRETVPLTSMAAQLSTDVAQARVQSAQHLQTGFAGARDVVGSARPQAPNESYFLVTRAAWTRLATWERTLTMRWLGVELPPFVQPPNATLPYLLLKLPLGLASALLPYYAFAAVVWMLNLAFTWNLDVLTLSDVVEVHHLVVRLVLVVLAVITVIAALFVTNIVGEVWGRFALIAYGGGETLRQLREAEARAKAERAKAERAEQSRRDLIMNVSHELRTPTASIRGHVESLLLALDQADGSAPSSTTFRSHLSIVHREAERLGTLIEELLALARSETDQLHLDMQPVHAADVVEEVYQTLAPLARRDRQVTLVREVQPDLPPLLADRQRLSQVLLNLVRNAITYTPPGGIVSITLGRADADQLVLAVSDTGVGIPAHELERVWERFYRTDQSRTRASGGFGLGLAIVRDLVEAMGGSVAAHSVEGEGSCFTIRFPVAPSVMVDDPSAVTQGG